MAGRSCWWKVAVWRWIIRLRPSDVVHACRCAPTRGRCHRTSNFRGCVRGSHATGHACTSVTMDASDRDHARRNYCLFRPRVRSRRRNAAGWRSQRPTVRRRLAVRLLRAWRDRLSLVCSLVSSLLQFTVYASSNIDCRTSVSGGGGQRSRSVGRKAQHSVAQNINFAAAAGVLCGEDGSQLGLPHDSRGSAAVLLRRARLQHDGKRAAGISTLCRGVHHARRNRTGVRLAASSRKTVDHHSSQTHVVLWTDSSQHLLRTVRVSWLQSRVGGVDYDHGTGLCCTSVGLRHRQFVGSVANARLDTSRHNEFNGYVGFHSGPICHRSVHGKQFYTWTVAESVLRNSCR